MRGKPESEPARQLEARIRASTDNELHEWVVYLAHQKAKNPDTFSRTDEVTRRRIETTIRRRARVKHRAARP